MKNAPRRTRPARWPLLVIGAPTAVAVWTGWVGLGTLCGFGTVEVLPGIMSWEIDSRITLPIGAEAYAIYALHHAISPNTPPAARRFAAYSSAGSFVLSLAAQITYHLLESNHVTRAPWPVVVLVSSVLVLAIASGSMLWHLVGQDIPDERADDERAATADLWESAATVLARDPARSVLRAAEALAPDERADDERDGTLTLVLDNDDGVFIPWSAPEPASAPYVERAEPWGAPPDPDPAPVERAPRRRPRRSPAVDEEAVRADWERAERSTDPADRWSGKRLGIALGIGEAAGRKTAARWRAENTTPEAAR